MEDEPPRKSWPGFFLKIGIGFAVVMAVIFTTLSMLGGKGRMLQAGVEQFFTRAFGQPARIEHFNSLHFFPDFRLDIEGLRVGALSEDGAGGTILPADAVFEIRSLKVAMGFWDMAMRTGRVKAFDLEGGEAAPGTFHPLRVRVDRLVVMSAAAEGGAPFLQGRGLVGAQPWTSHMGLVDDGAPGYPQYRFGTRRDFIFTLADLKLEGALVDNAGDLVAEGFRVSRAGGDILGGRPVLQFQAGAGEALLVGDLELHARADRRYVLSPALKIIRAAEGLDVSGTLGVPGDSGAAGEVADDAGDDADDDVSHGAGMSADVATDVAEGFEALRRDIQNLSGYPLEYEGRPMLFGVPLRLDVAIEQNGGAP